MDCTLFFSEILEYSRKFYRKFMFGSFFCRSYPPSINRTHVCLIPKNPNASSLRDFRSISLCNTTYKIITKIIASRLKPILNNIIRPYQSRFLQNRQTSNNVIFVQELVSYIAKKKKGKTGHMLLKIDLEKAFNRFEWSFIFWTLHYFANHPKLINLIMSCQRNCYPCKWKDSPII